MYVQSSMSFWKSVMKKWIVGITITFSFHLLLILPLFSQVQAILDHHHNADVKTATKVRFQEPGKEGGLQEADESNEEETKEVKL